MTFWKSGPRGRDFSPIPARTRILYIHPQPLPYPLWSIPPVPRTSFFPSPSIPVDVVFSHCPICRSPELYWQQALQLTSVRMSFFAAGPKYSAPAIRYIFRNHVINFTAQFTEHSNAFARFVIVCRISKATPRGSRKITNSIHAGSPQLPFPSPRYSRNIRPYSRRFPAESAGFPPSPFPYRPLICSTTQTYYSIYGLVYRRLVTF